VRSRRVFRKTQSEYSDRDFDAAASEAMLTKRHLETGSADSYLGAAMSGGKQANGKSEAIFPRLRAGRQAISPEAVARHQRARLQGAMVEAVASHGYADTTVRELVGLAGVSKSAFYDHFENKQECFLTTFETIVAELSKRVGEAYRQPGDFREKLVAALGAFMETAEEEPAAARLAAVESLTLGPAGVAHRERASVTFEALIGQSFEHSPSPIAVSEVTVRAIVAGIRGVAYRRLRMGREDELPGLTEELVDWALSYQRPPGEALELAMEAAREPAQPEPEEDPAPGWGEPPDSPRSRTSLSQRERVIRGAGRLVVEHGYQALSIPAISAAAGVSNQTFYEHFESKRDAFLAAFEALAAKASAVTARAAAEAGPGPRANGAAVRAMLEHVAGNELFARLAFFELPTAGPAALDRADAVMDSFTALIDLHPEEGGADLEMSQVIREAVGSGTWAAIQHEIAHGRRDKLPELAPAVVALTMAPLTQTISTS
jgi:AcrR family transcriptional regulator